MTAQHFSEYFWDRTERIVRLDNIRGMQKHDCTREALRDYYIAKQDNDTTDQEIEEILKEVN